MTPEERNLITELFNRIATLENAPRDPNAEQAIYDGFQQAPNAAYALVQTVLVQDEALKRAEARINELEGNTTQEAPRDTSFLGNMRQSLGLGESRRAGSVPSVKPGMSSAWRNTGAPAVQPQPEPMQQQAPAQMAPAQMAPAGGGSSFLGTAAAAAAGVVGGSLLMGGLRSMMGGGGHAHSAFDPSAGSGRGGGAPWSGGDSAGGDLSRQAGLEDMGRSRGGNDANRMGMLDNNNANAGDVPDSGDYSDQGDVADDASDGGDFGGDGGGGEE